MGSIFEQSDLPQESREAMTVLDQLLAPYVAGDAAQDFVLDVPLLAARHLTSPIEVRLIVRYAPLATAAKTRAGWALSCQAQTGGNAFTFGGRLEVRPRFRGCGSSLELLGSYDVPEGTPTDQEILVLCVASITARMLLDRLTGAVASLGIARTPKT